jgi:hypothetical protein
MLLRMSPVALCLSACVTQGQPPAPFDAPGSTLVIHSFASGLSTVRAASAAVGLSIRRDPAVSDEAVLEVDYPAASPDPAARDVWCDVESRDWTRGSVIRFGIKPDRAIPISVSFLDGNRVAYTAFVSLQAGVWQTVRIPLDSIEPNPYFQPPGADLDARLDVRDVARIGLAPQDPEAGRFSLTDIVLVE